MGGMAAGAQDRLAGNRNKTLPLVELLRGVESLADAHLAGGEAELAHAPDGSAGIGRDAEDDPEPHFPGGGSLRGGLQRESGCRGPEESTAVIVRDLRLILHRWTGVRRIRIMDR